VLAGRRRAARGVSRPAHAGAEPAEPVRPRAAERAAQGGRPAAGQLVNVLQRYGAPPDPSSKALLNGQRPGSGGAAGAAISLTEITKVYGRGQGAVHAVDRLSLTVADGEFVCLVGASGCGKSTLLSIVAGLDTPTAGQVDTGGRRVAIMFQ